jgi:protein SCO1/2
MVGDSVNIMALTNSVGFHFQREGDGFIHPPALIAISPKGTITRYILGTDFEPFDIKMAMIEAGRGMSQPTISRVLQFCYRYDPSGKKYVFNFTKVVGGVLLVAVVVFLSILLVKGKKKKNTEGE